MPTPVERQYDEYAAEYDVRWGVYVEKTLTRLVGSLELGGREAVLDVACGTGELERLLRRRWPGLTLTGVDVSEGMLGVAQRKFSGVPGVTFLKADAGALPFPDGSFARVLSANAFHYFPDPVQALREMRRVLAPGGRIVIVDWCRDFFLCAAYDLVLRLMDPAHVRCFKTSDVEAFANEAGLAVERLQTFRAAWLWGLMEIELSPRPEAPAGGR